MRLRIVVALSAAEELSCKSIDLPVVKSTCTHHFRVLREAGVIRQRHEGTSRLNSLRRADLDRRFPGLLDSVLGALRHSYHAALVLTFDNLGEATELERGGLDPGARLGEHPSVTEALPWLLDALDALRSARNLLRRGDQLRAVSGGGSVDR